MYDWVIRDARVIDGTGAASRRADVAISAGRIAEIGNRLERGRREINADGQALAPGFIDLHTHYDAQVFWDPTLSPSCFHGVTTVAAGNCGFSIAPLTKEAAPYLLGMLSRVEGIPAASLKAGVPWDWQSFADYLSRLEGRIGLNMGFMCGHSALRRIAMGERANSAKATCGDLAAMQALLRESLRAGALGFSTTTSPTHSDPDGNPVPSRCATHEEMFELARTCRDFPGTVLEIVPGVGDFSEDQIELLIGMSLAAQRSINWNPLVVTPGNEERIAHQLHVSDRARAAGAKIVGLAMAASPTTRLNFHSGFLFDSLPGWGNLFRLSPERRIAELRSPQRRKELADGAASDHPMKALVNWGRYVINDSGNQAMVGRSVADIAHSEGKGTLDVMFDIAIEDNLKTVFMPPPIPETDELARRKIELWRDDRIIVGASDSGAHLDMIDAFAATTSFLATTRKHEGISLEDAIRMLTKAPADLLGLKNRGTIREGSFADLLLFDPDRIAAEPTRVLHDLPGGEMRLYADAKGISHVFVNGSLIVEEGAHTGVLPGSILRSGIDTDTGSIP
jgi:N-acyl-D-aspartate/D-glutamate deacylase